MKFVMKNMAFAAILLSLVATARLAATEPRLWIGDDVTDTIYEVAVVNGRLQRVSSFPAPRLAQSGLAVDPLNGCLWGVAEGGRTTGIPGRVSNFNRQGLV